MVETWEYENEDFVFEFGQEVQRRDAHTSKGGASRSACRFGHLSELKTRSTTSPLSPSIGSSIEQRGYKNVHKRECGLNTLFESSWLVPVRSVFWVWNEMGLRSRSTVWMTTIRVDS